MMDIPVFVLRALRCHKCNQYLSRSPVYLDPDGVQICSQCYQPDEPAARNITYEAVAKLLKFPCKYYDMGCPVTVPFVTESADIAHEQSCDYRPFLCPIMGAGGCPWIGSRSTMLEHCYAKHPDRVLANPSNMALDITKSSENYFLITAFGMVFLLKIKVCLSTDKVVYTVTCLDYLTTKFQFSLDIRRHFNVISRHGDLLDHEPSSIAFSISCLVDVFDGFEGTIFTFTIKEICSEELNDPRMSFRSDPSDPRLSFRPDTNDPRMSYRSDPNDQRMSVRGNQNDLRMSFRSEPDPRMSVRGDPNDPRMSVRGEPNETRMSVRGEPNEPRMSVRGDPNDQRMSFRSDPNDLRMSVRGEPNEPRMSVRGDPNDQRMSFRSDPDPRMSVRGEPNDFRMSIRGEPNDPRMSLRANLSDQRVSFMHDNDPRDSLSPDSSSSRLDFFGKPRAYAGSDYIKECCKSKKNSSSDFKFKRDPNAPLCIMKDKKKVCKIQRDCKYKKCATHNSKLVPSTSSDEDSIISPKQGFLGKTDSKTHTKAYLAIPNTTFPKPKQEFKLVNQPELNRKDSTTKNCQLKNCPSKDSKVAPDSSSDDTITSPKQVFFDKTDSKLHANKSSEDIKPKQAVSLFQGVQQSDDKNKNIIEKDSYMAFRETFFPRNKNKITLFPPIQENDTTPLANQNQISNTPAPKDSYMEFREKFNPRDNQGINLFPPISSEKIFFEDDEDMKSPYDGENNITGNFPSNPNAPLCTEKDKRVCKIQKDCKYKKCAPANVRDLLDSPGQFETDTIDNKKRVSIDDKPQKKIFYEETPTVLKCKNQKIPHDDSNLIKDLPFKDTSITSMKEKEICQNHCRGCSYKDTSYKLWKHTWYFCPYTPETRCSICSNRIPKNSLLQHYDCSHNNITIPNGSTWSAVQNCMGHFFVDTPYGTVIGWYSRKNKRFVLNLYSPLNSEELKNVRCTIKLKNPVHMSKSCANRCSCSRCHAELYENYDWTMRRSDFPAEILEFTINIDDRSKDHL